MLKDPVNLSRFVKISNACPSKNVIGKITEISLGTVGLHQSRDINMNNWGAKFLSQEQVLQAALDTQCAFLVGKSSQGWHSACCAITYMYSFSPNNASTSHSSSSYWIKKDKGDCYQFNIVQKGKPSISSEEMSSSCFTTGTSNTKCVEKKNGKSLSNVKMKEKWWESWRFISEGRAA